MSDTTAPTVPPAPPTATGLRLAWSQVPPHVRAAIGASLGAPVVEAVSQPGGFTPGSADRVQLGDGKRVFVKAVGDEVNADSPRMHRQEIAITAAMPVSAPVPRLLASYDDGSWVALVLEDVDGRPPAMPWSARERDRVATALTDLARALTPSPLPDVPAATEALGGDLTAWDDVAAARPDDLDPWARRNLDRLRKLGRAAVDAVRGDTLLHCDVRADNLLLTDDRVYLVDWPHAVRGAAWFDRCPASYLTMFGRRRPPLTGMGAC